MNKKSKGKVCNMLISKGKRKTLETQKKGKRMKKKKIFAYLRVSGPNQIKGSGFDRQIETIQKFCNQSGYEIERVFREQISGTKDETKRPIFNDMVKEILADGVNTLIVEQLDRLARQYFIQETLLIYLASKGITLIAANTGENVTEAIQADPIKKALVQMQGIFAELDKNQLSLRLFKGRQAKKAKGNWQEGPKPYGKHPKFQKEKEVLKKIASMRRKTTKNKRPTTYQVIADYLNKEDIKTRSGKQWSASLVCNILRKSRKKKSVD